MSQATFANYHKQVKETAKKGSLFMRLLGYEDVFLFLHSLVLGYLSL